MKPIENFMKMFKTRWRKADRASRALELQALEQQQPPAPKQDYLDNSCHRTYSCIHCRAHLANHDELISKLFQGNHGRAYLFNKVVNIGCKQAVERELLTGLHAVADIYCDSCETTLGWKYEQAFVPSQKYKEGKYIIELVHMLKENSWDLTSHNNRELLEEIEGTTKYDPTCLLKNRWRSLAPGGPNKSNTNNKGTIDRRNKTNRSNVIEFGKENCRTQSTPDAEDQQAVVVADIPMAANLRSASVSTSANLPASSSNNSTNSGEPGSESPPQLERPPDTRIDIVDEDRRDPLESQALG